MERRQPFVDIHCHLLPGLDDGAADLDDALAMAEIAVADGIETVVATPHQLGGHTANSGANIRAAAASFQEALDRRGLPLRVLPGGDVRIEPDLPRKIRIGEVLTLADRRRHVLLELPHEVYLPLDRLLAELDAAGMVGILSHPERNRGIINRPEILRPLVRQGCLLQLTAGSLTGAFGSQVQRFSELLLTQGLVHIVASDAHGTRTRPPALLPAFRRICELAGCETALRLCCRNPSAVAAGNAVSAGCRKTAKSAWTKWFFRNSTSEHAVA